MLEYSNFRLHKQQHLFISEITTTLRDNEIRITQDLISLMGENYA